MDTRQRRHIAETIRTARLRRGWTTTESAGRLETSDANWSRWETAHATPRPATLLRLGELLDLPEGWWEMPEATLSQPSRTVDPDELLERIRAELAEHERRIEQMLARMTGADNAKPNDALDGERDGGRDVSDARHYDGARLDGDSR